eukprot:1894181-Rhodomonas_salina.1
MAFQPLLMCAEAIKSRTSAMSTLLPIAAGSTRQAVVQRSRTSLLHCVKRLYSVSKRDFTMLTRCSVSHEQRARPDEQVSAGKPQRHALARRRRKVSAGVREYCHEERERRADGPAHDAFESPVEA